MAKAADDPVDCECPAAVRDDDGDGPRTYPTSSTYLTSESTVARVRYFKTRASLLAPPCELPVRLLGSHRLPANDHEQRSRTCAGLDKVIRNL